MALALNKVKHWKQIHFAFDHPEYEEAVRSGIEILESANISPSELMFYVLVGFGTTEIEDLHRVEVLRELGVDPFVMPYDKADHYQKRFARWANHKAIFKTVAWEDYKP